MRLDLFYFDGVLGFVVMLITKKILVCSEKKFYTS